jgi:hypothetical protein
MVRRHLTEWVGHSFLAAGSVYTTTHSKRCMGSGRLLRSVHTKKPRLLLFEGHRTLQGRGIICLHCVYLVLETRQQRRKYTETLDLDESRCTTNSFPSLLAQVPRTCDRLWNSPLHATYAMVVSQVRGPRPRTAAISLRRSKNPGVSARAWFQTSTSTSWTRGSSHLREHTRSFSSVIHSSSTAATEPVRGKTLRNPMRVRKVMHA